MKKTKNIIVLGLASLLIMSSLVGCSTTKEISEQNNESQIKVGQVITKKPKYVFLFIGDGMSHTQVNAAQVYNGTIKNKDKVKLEKLGFTQFPVIGNATTQNATSFITDSAAAATSIAGGVKTQSGVIGLASDKKTKTETIAEKLKKEGYKVGVVSSVALNHATPAAFYAHTKSRGNYYDIAQQMANSNFDYFAGGALLNSKGLDKKQKDTFDILKEKGYKITNDKDEIMSLNSESGKVYAINPQIQDSFAMEYSIDSDKDSIMLNNFVKKGIDVLDNEKGFFMMVESGKIDWAGHANDAMTNISDVSELDKAVSEAVKFANKHSDETLILVTGDHETGGMSIGQATTGYDTAFDILENQKISYVEFNELLNKYKEKTKEKDAKLEDLLPIIKENFGLITKDDKDVAKKDNKNLVVSDHEYKKLQDAFKETMKEKDKRKEDEVIYGNYEPLSVTLTHIMNNKAGIGWTSYSHTGVPVPVYAMGASSEVFNGSYDNTDIFKKLVEVCGLK
ncbi:alkaline phosphatase [Romboutsia lituseburensis]|uniref:alkaline phosphatase n=1 Tax=Romboutsia lituseburensis TaxID=1537 RepID=UPI00215AA0E0|nr:alkaline phosphatase [Romboutsia lituseburensis]MCR8744774.1 alkaline phosphatase [Romboutsia lituseburensis]